MSQRRKVTLGKLDLEALKASARSRGKQVEEYSKVDLYYTKEECDVVVNKKVGFSADSNGEVTALYDDMYTDQYADIMADYFEDVGTINGYSTYHVVARHEDKETVTVSVEGY